MMFMLYLFVYDVHMQMQQDLNVGNGEVAQQLMKHSGDLYVAFVSTRMSIMSSLYSSHNQSPIDSIDIDQWNDMAHFECNLGMMGRLSPHKSVPLLTHLLRTSMRNIQVSQ